MTRTYWSARLGKLKVQYGFRHNPSPDVIAGMRRGWRKWFYLGRDGATQGIVLVVAKRRVVWWMRERVRPRPADLDYGYWDDHTYPGEAR